MKAAAFKKSKKTIGLDLFSKTKFCSFFTLFLHFFAAVARQRREQEKTIFFNSFLNLRYSPLEFNSKKDRQHLTNWMGWNNSNDP